MKETSRQGKTAVVVGTITNDLRVYDVPKLSVNKQHIKLLDYFSEN